MMTTVTLATPSTRKWVYAGSLLKQLMFRSTYSTGFRAPSLYEINAPQSQTYTGAKYDDPVLCPGGVSNFTAISNRM